MEDWLQELEPLAQQSLQKARKAVECRGGGVVSVEDYLLALLEHHPSLSSFLYSRGIALDELIRTIQCEQPLVTLSSETAGLSSELINWLAMAREIVGRNPLSVAQLLRVLTHRCERLSQRAYVAVLEQVPEQSWPALDRGEPVVQPKEDAAMLPLGGATDELLPASESLLEAARRITAQLLSDPVPLIHLQSHSSLIARSMITHVRQELEQLSGMTVEASRMRVSDCCRNRGFSLVNTLHRCLSSTGACRLVMLQGATPELLEALLRREGVLLWQSLISQGRMIPLLVSRPTIGSGQSVRWLEAQFDRPLVEAEVPPLGIDDVLGYLRARQPLLEKRVGMQITGDALFLAASHCTFSGECPGNGDSDPVPSAPGAEPEHAESTLRAAAAMVQADRVCGNARLAALRASWQRRQREELVALARPGDATAHQADGDLSLELAAEEASWMEAREQSLVLDGEAVRKYLCMD